MKYKEIIKTLLLTCCFYCSNLAVSVAELSYNFTTKKFSNGLTEDSKKSLVSEEDKEKVYYNFKDTKDKNNDDKEKIQPTGDKNNDIKLKIGGLVEAQYYYTNQPYEYKRDILPNGQRHSFAEINNYSVVNDGNSNTLNMLGKIDINPEFNRYKIDDVNGKKTAIITAGAKISQPFYNSTKNTDPRLASQEYVYLKTNYFSNQLNLKKHGRIGGVPLKDLININFPLPPLAMFLFSILISDPSAMDADVAGTLEASLL